MLPCFGLGCFKTQIFFIEPTANSTVGWHLHKRYLIWYTISRFSRCCTARGSSTGFCWVGSAKVKASKDCSQIGERMSDNDESCQIYIRWLKSKYEHICLFVSCILEKHIHIFEYDIFLKSIFVMFYEIVFKRKYDKLRLQKHISLLDFSLKICYHRIYTEIRSYLLKSCCERVIAHDVINNLSNKYTSQYCVNKVFLVSYEKDGTLSINVTANTCPNPHFRRSK